MASAPSKTTIDARVKLFDTMANSIAWHVGVVTPGFLGLLWYSDKLAKATWLPRGGFVAVFVLSELFFLLAIIGALILHNALVHYSSSYSMTDIALEGLKALNDAVSEGRELSEDEVAAGNTYLKQLKRLEAAIQDRFPLMWLFERLHGAMTLAGYVGLAIIIFTTRLG